MPIDPLPLDIWFQRLEWIEAQLTGTGSVACPRLLRHAFHMLELTPEPLRPFIKAEIAEKEFEALLAKELFEDAVVLLVVPPFKLSVFSDEDGDFAAVSELKETAITGSGRHALYTVAVLQSWMRCLLALKRERVQ